MAESQPPRGEPTRMSPETFAQQWSQIRQHLREWWDHLTEQDLEQIAGQQDRLVRVIQERYQYLHECAQGEVDQRLQAYQAADSPMAEALIAAADEAASRLPQTAAQGQPPTGEHVPAGSVHHRPGGAGATPPCRLGADRPGGRRATRPQPWEGARSLKHHPVPIPARASYFLHVIGRHLTPGQFAAVRPMQTALARLRDLLRLHECRQRFQGR
jgi:uncharacterized protein YjbJ (UPF0337 family)